jgi:hypothetical protein
MAITYEWSFPNFEVDGSDNVKQDFTEEDVGCSISANLWRHHQNAKGYEKIVSHWLLYTTRIDSLHK